MYLTLTTTSTFNLFSLQPMYKLSNFIVFPKLISPVLHGHTHRSQNALLVKHYETNINISLFPNRLKILYQLIVSILRVKNTLFQQSIYKKIVSIKIIFTPFTNAIYIMILYNTITVNYYCLQK